MTIELTKNGWLGLIKGRIGDTTFAYQVLGDSMKSVRQQLIFEVDKLRAYACLAA
jgi:hypothetical protein